MIKKNKKSCTGSLQTGSSTEDKSQATTRAIEGEVTEEGSTEGTDSGPLMACNVRTESLTISLPYTEVCQLDSTEPVSLFPKAVSCPV